MAEILAGRALAQALAGLEGWQPAAAGAAIRKSFRFDGFMAAFAFMRRVAVYADTVDHHPEWCNVHGRVEVTLTSHDAGGVSRRDIAMARFMDKAANRPAWQA